MQIENEVKEELSGIFPENGETGPTPDGEVEAEDVGVPEPDSTNNPGTSGGSVAEPETEVEAAETGEVEDTDDIKELLNSGKNAYREGNYEKAIGYCDKVLLIDPENSEALFFRKRTLSKIEKSQEGPEDTAVQTDLPAQEMAQAIEADVGGFEETEDEVIETAQETVEEPEGETDAEDDEITQILRAELGDDFVSGGAAEADVEGAEAGGGDPNCKSCGGSGECHWCKSTGKCYWCKGTGNCDKCNGQGEVGGEMCKTCSGSGKCHSCKGESTCYWCNGSGKCTKCNA